MITYYLREFRTTKPEYALWWGDVFPDQAKEYSDTVKALGLVKHIKYITEDENNKKCQIYFESSDAHDEFRNSLQSLDFLAFRHNYNIQNGIGETILYSDLIEVDPATL